MKHEAIYNLYPNAKSIKDSDTLTAYDINGQEVSIDMDAVNAKAIELQEAEDAAIAQKATDKTNAKAKLIAGEALTEAEADTIVL